MIEKIGNRLAGRLVAALRNPQPSTLNPQRPSTLNSQLSTLKLAFTLIEVNLAIFIMAGGVLAMISLYSLGFRESKQSREDVASAAIADEVLNPLVVALSSRKLKWSEWKGLNFARVSAGSGSGMSGANIQVMPGSGGAGSVIFTRSTGSHPQHSFRCPSSRPIRVRLLTKAT